MKSTKNTERILLAERALKEADRLIKSSEKPEHAKIIERSKKHIQDFHRNASKVHEGQILKAFILDKGESISDVADKMNLTKQNLYYHFRKPKLEPAAKRLFAQHGYNAFGLPIINYGQALKNYLEHHGLSPQDLEKQTKISFNTIYYALGKEVFSQELMEALEKAKIDVTKYATKQTGLKAVNSEINRLKDIIKNRDKTIEKLKSELREINKLVTLKRSKGTPKK